LICLPKGLTGQKLGLAELFGIVLLSFWIGRKWSGWPCRAFVPAQVLVSGVDGCEERLDGGVLIAIAVCTHPLPQSVLWMRPLGGARQAIAIFKARIAKPRFIRLPTVASGMQVQDHSQGEPIFTRPDIGNLTGPFLVHIVRCKVTGQQIGRDVDLCDCCPRWPNVCVF
jgi:hypothetical protein